MDVFNLKKMNFLEYIMFLYDIYELSAPLDLFSTFVVHVLF